MRLWIGLSTLLFSVSAFSSVGNFDLRQQVQTYKDRYGLSDVYTKLTDNKGDGYEDMYGTRNVRAVLHGILYRGGANNVYSKIEKRPNKNPLPDYGVSNLCDQGFSEAIYLYPTNFNTAVPFAQCVTQGWPNHIDYEQISALRVGNEKQLMMKIYDHIKGTTPGPLYTHCWNGWHASGYVSALALQQFCRWTPSQARAYWVKNTDGNKLATHDIENRILAFHPFMDLQITSYEQNLICP